MVSFSKDIHNKQVIIVSLSSMMRSLGMGASWPFMAIFLSLYLHIAIYIVGIIFTLLSLMSMIFSILGGYLADLKGRKFTLMHWHIIFNGNWRESGQWRDIRR